MTNRMYWLWLTTRQGISAYTATQLVRHVGTPAFLYGATAEQLSHTELLKADEVKALCNKDLTQPHKIIADCERYHVSIITLDDSSYPPQLHALEDAPCVLYLRGKMPDFDLHPPICIVGTRSASAYGTTMAMKFATALAKAGFSIVAGTAVGVETAVHTAALKAGGQVLAVQAGGVELPYPYANRFLLGDIAMLGGILSENPPETDNAGFRFPLRNRIMSGIAHGVLVVEAPALRSGAFITARWALEQGKEVFAIPTNIDATNTGCNMLIQKGEAMLVSDPRQIAQTMEDVLHLQPNYRAMAQAFANTQAQTQTAPPVPEPPQPVAPPVAEKATEAPTQAPIDATLLTTQQPPIPAGLDGETLTIATLLKEGVHVPDEISQRAGITPAHLMARLTMMEIEGIIQNLQGMYYLL